MKNVPEVRVGIVVGSTDWMPEEYAINKRKALYNYYVDVYDDESVYECPICISDNDISVKRAMKDIKKAECNAVCLYYANYGPEMSGSLFAQEYDGPIIIIGAADEAEEPLFDDRADSLSGFVNACYALGLRRKNVFVPDNPVSTIPICAGMINDFVPIARAVIAIKRLKIISFSPRPSSYLASYAPYHLLIDMGVEVSDFSELELYNSYNKHEGDRRIEKIIDEMKNEVEIDNDAILNKLHDFAQYELTITDWIRGHRGERDYVVLTSTCWPAFPVSFGFVPCYVNSRLTCKGYPVACEVDVYGAVSEYIGQCISGDVVTILNINNNIPRNIYEKKIMGNKYDGKEYEYEDVMLGYHCGVTPSCKLSSARLGHHFVNKRLIGEECSMGTIQGRLSSAKVTIFRIQAMRDNRIRAYVAQGQLLPVQIDTYGGYGIIAISQFMRFLRNVIIERHFPNHCAVLFGHFGRELINLLKALGVEEIYYNHPKEIPYPNENFYSLMNDWF